MEILRKFKLATAALALFIIVSANPLVAQTFEATQQAFSKSYDYETQGTYAKAIEELKKVYLADSYEINLRLGWLSYLQGQFTESSAYYLKAMTLKPFSIEAKFGYVYPLAAAGNWALVKTQYFEIIKIDPQNTLANYRLGLIYYNTCDFQTASKYLEKVVNLYPFDYDSMVLYAWTNLKLGKLREAEILFKKVLLIKPADESAKEGLSLVK
jgi:tetratricopeptide (TPR) repeat protein